MNDTKAVQRVYAEEAKARWGGTDAWQESEGRMAAYTGADWQEIQGGMTQLFEAFASVRALEPGDERVQALVERWKQYITDHFYACTDEILEGLGAMYTADERFRANIDRCGEGTAACMSRAIAAYCAAKR